MDIIFHITILIVIALLFFMQKYSKSQNPMLFIILLCVISLSVLWQDDTYITTGFNTTAEYNYTTHTATSETYPVKTQFPNEWMLYLVYITFFLIAIANFTANEEYGVFNKK